MNFESFLNAAKKFAKETKNWGGLEENKLYTTSGDEWAETSDNAHGGLYLDWAFHMTEKEIEKEAPNEFFSMLMQDLENLLDDDDVTREQVLETVKERYGC